MRLSEARAVKSLLNSYSVREALERMNDGESDFEVDNYRFIDKAAIDDILAEELESDLYVLGCFNADFLADSTGLPRELIEACQNAEAFEALGKAIADGGHVRDLALNYAGADGYGHHFNHWDGTEERIGAYYVFRTN